MPASTTEPAPASAAMKRTRTWAVGVTKEATFISWRSQAPREVVVESTCTHEAPLLFDTWTTKASSTALLPSLTDHWYQAITGSVTALRSSTGEVSVVRPLSMSWSPIAPPGAPRPVTKQFTRAPGEWSSSGATGPGPAPSSESWSGWWTTGGSAGSDDCGESRTSPAPSAAEPVPFGLPFAHSPDVALSPAADSSQPVDVSHASYRFTGSSAKSWTSSTPPTIPIERSTGM